MPLPTPTPINILADPYLALAAIGKVVNAGLKWGVALLAILALVYVFIGGFSILTAGDDPKKMAQGRRTLLWAIIGLVLGASVFAIISTISETVPGGLPGISTLSCRGTPLMSSYRCVSSPLSVGKCMTSTAPTCPAGQQGAAKVVSCSPVPCDLPFAGCLNCAGPIYECIMEEYCE